MATAGYYRSLFRRMEVGEVLHRLPSGISFPAPEELVVPTGRSLPHTAAFTTFPVFQPGAAPADVRRKNIHCLPLTQVAVTVDVLSTVARASLVQTFTNFSDEAIAEARYSFPLYDGAAVTSFRCAIGDDKVLEGRVKPKAEARAEYKAAVAEQRVAGLLEEHTPEVFETLLGNIPPRTTIKVGMTYVSELKPTIDGDGVLVIIPTSIAPRYGTPPAGSSLAPAADSVNAALQVVVNVSSAVPVRKLESQTHPISVEMGSAGTTVPASTFGDLTAAAGGEYDPKKARAVLSSKQAVLGRDFDLAILTAVSNASTPWAVAEKATGKGHSAMMVTISPRHIFSSQPAQMKQEFKGEIIFMADRSGSMAGAKIQTLRESLKVFLKSLPTSCHFNLHFFGSSCASLWPKSRPYSQKLVDEAMHQLSGSFEADMGGTEILSALRNVVLQHQATDGFSSQVILLTDGEVWETDKTIKFVEDSCRDSQENLRFFALGIGDEVSHRLIECLGRVGGGFGEVVSADPGNRWDTTIIRMLKGALTPKSWNCTLQLDSRSQNPSLDYVQAPYQMNPIHTFAQRSTFFLLDPELCDVPESVIVKTMTPSGETLSATLPVTSVTTPWNVLHSAAAKAVIADLESGKSHFHAIQGSGLTQDALDAAIRHEAERLGQLYHLTSKWTSFVATDKKGSEASAEIYKPARGLICPSGTPFSLGELGLQSYPDMSLLPSSGSNFVTTILSSSRQSALDFEFADNSHATTYGFQSPTGSDIFEDSPSELSQPVSISDFVAIQTAAGSFPLPVSVSARVMEAFESRTLPDLVVAIRDQNFLSLQRIEDLKPGQNSPAESQTAVEEHKAPGVGEVPDTTLSLTGESDIAAATAATASVMNPPLEIALTAISVFFLRNKFPDDVEIWELMVSKAESWLMERLSRRTESEYVMRYLARMLLG